MHITNKQAGTTFEKLFKKIESHLRNLLNNKGYGKFSSKKLFTAERVKRYKNQLKISIVSKQDLQTLKSLQRILEEAGIDTVPPLAAKTPKGNKRSKQLT